MQNREIRIEADDENGNTIEMFELPHHEIMRDPTPPKCQYCDDLYGPLFLNLYRRPDEIHYTCSLCSNRIQDGQDLKKATTKEIPSKPVQQLIDALYESKSSSIVPTRANDKTLTRESLYAFWDSRYDDHFVPIFYDGPKWRTKDERCLTDFNMHATQHTSTRIGKKVNNVLVKYKGRWTMVYRF